MFREPSMCDLWKFIRTSFVKLQLADFGKYFTIVWKDFSVFQVDLHYRSEVELTNCIIKPLIFFYLLVFFGLFTLSVSERCLLKFPNQSCRSTAFSLDLFNIEATLLTAHTFIFILFFCFSWAFYQCIISLFIYYYGFHVEFHFVW